MPILGVIDSAKSGRLTSFESIATSVVGAGGTSSITFSSIPQTFKHLQIRGFASCGGDINFRFNGDTGANYNYHLLYGAGSGGQFGGSANIEYGYFGYGAFNASSWSPFVADFLDYTSTVKMKPVRCLFGNKGQASGGIMLNTSLWRNSSSAITSITIFSKDNQTILQNSSFALYGMKGQVNTMPAGSTYSTIATQTLGSAASSVTFSSIPQNFTDLILVSNQFYVSTGGDRSATFQVGNGSVNTGSNYGWTFLDTYPGTISSGNSNNQPNGLHSYTASIPTTIPLTCTMQLMNYSSTATNKSFLNRFSASNTITGAYVNIWQQTTAINIITITAGGANFATGSSFTLYGIAAA